MKKQSLREMTPASEFVISVPGGGCSEADSCCWSETPLDSRGKADELCCYGHHGSGRWRPGRKKNEIRTP